MKKEFDYVMFFGTIGIFAFFGYLGGDYFDLFNAGGFYSMIFFIYASAVIYIAYKVAKGEFLN